MAATAALPAGPPQLGPKPTLVSAWFCPFAQRTWIAFNAKGQQLFTLHSITAEELYGKPEWFKALNPAGLIPIIAWEGAAGAPANAPTAASSIEGKATAVTAVTESLICNEFLEDVYRGVGAPLLPEAPAARAAARLAIDRFGSKGVPAFYRLLVRQDQESRAAAAAALDDAIRGFVGGIAGPLALGQGLSLVDAAVAPFLLRLFILEHYRGYKPPADVADKLESYLAAVAAHPAVAPTLVHPDPQASYRQELLGTYERYADGSANSQMAAQAKE